MDELGGRDMDGPSLEGSRRVSGSDGSTDARWLTHRAFPHFTGMIY